MPGLQRIKLEEGRDEKVPDRVVVVIAHSVARKKNTNREFPATDTDVEIAEFP